MFGNEYINTHQRISRLLGVRPFAWTVIIDCEPIIICWVLPKNTCHEISIEKTCSQAISLLSPKKMFAEYLLRASRFGRNVRHFRSNVALRDVKEVTKGTKSAAEATVRQTKTPDTEEVLGKWYFSHFSSHNPNSRLNTLTNILRVAFVFGTRRSAQLVLCVLPSF